jgi:hypothetical protein
MTHTARLGEMRSSVFWCLVSLLVALPTATHTQASLCGNPPPVEDEQLKGDINGKAQFLSHFLGDASLGGKSSRPELKYFQATRMPTNAPTHTLNMKCV